jgi:hypothetical protein
MAGTTMYCQGCGAERIPLAGTDQIDLTQPCPCGSRTWASWPPYHPQTWASPALVRLTTTWPR